MDVWCSVSVLVVDHLNLRSSSKHSPLSPSCPCSSCWPLERCIKPTCPAWQDYSRKHLYLLLSMTASVSFSPSLPRRVFLTEQRPLLSNRNLLERADRWRDENERGREWLCTTCCSPGEELPDHFTSSAPNSSVFDHGPLFDKFVSLPHVHNVSNLIDGLLVSDQMELVWEALMV